MATRISDGVHAHGDECRHISLSVSLYFVTNDASDTIRESVRAKKTNTLNLLEKSPYIKQVPLAELAGLVLGKHRLIGVREIFFRWVLFLTSGILDATC